MSQTDGEDLPQFAKISGDPHVATDPLKALVAANGIALDYNDQIRPAFGVSSGGSITLLPGLSAAEEFSVLTHETAHELLHRGDRRKSGVAPRAETNG